MSNKFSNYFGFGESNLIDQDEILSAVQNRAAFKTVRITSTILLFASIILLFVMPGDEWQYAGYVLFGAFFLLVLVFDILLAADGVFKGQDELMARLSLPKSVVVRRAIYAGLLTAILTSIFTNILVEDLGTVQLLVQGAVSGIVIAVLVYRQWSKAVRSTSL